jgi:hypothetical protein
MAIPTITAVSYARGRWPACNGAAVGYSPFGDVRRWAVRARKRLRISPSEGSHRMDAAVRSPLPRKGSAAVC